MATGRRISISVDSTGVNRVVRDLNKTHTAGDRVVAGFKRMTTGLKTFAKRALVTTAVIAGLAYGASRLARAVLSPFMSLEKTMARVRIAEGATIEQTKMLTDVASQLGRDTLYSASQAAEGMLYLAKAGLDVQQTMAAIPGVLQAAIVEEMDLGQAADIVTGLLNEFGLAASQAGLAADVLAKGSNLAKTNMPEMSEALKYFGATAHELGYDIQFSVAMLDVLAGKMIRGTMAGTAMRQSMITFQKIQASGAFITKAQSTAINRLGLDAGKLAKQISAGDLTFIKFISTLKKAGATTGDFASIFEQRAAVAVNALAEAAETAFPAYVDQLNDAVGFTKEAGAILEDTLWGQTQQIKSSIETMTNALAETFAPGLQDFLEHELRPWINDITEAWKTGGDTWQEKLKTVWEDQLLPTMKSGMQKMAEAIESYMPLIALQLGKAAVQGVGALITGIGMGIDTAIWEAMKKVYNLPGNINEAMRRAREAAEAAATPYDWDALFPYRERKPVTLTPAAQAQIQQQAALSAGLPPLSGLAAPGPLPGLTPGTPALDAFVVKITDPLYLMTERLGYLLAAADKAKDLLAEIRDAEQKKTQAAFWEGESGQFISSLANQFMAGEGGQWISELLGPGAAGVVSQTVTGGLAGAAEGGLSAAAGTAFATAGGWPAILASVLLKVFLPALGDLLTSIFGKDELRGRSVGAGAFAYAGGGIARTPQLALVAEHGPEMILPVSSAGAMGGTSIDASVHIENLSVAGEDADEITHKFKQEIQAAQEYASRQLARQMKQGMVKREAMEA